MLISIRYVIDRLRHPRSRAEEVARLRRQLVQQPGAVPPAEAAAAQELALLRQELADALGAVRSCSGCARGHPPPHGRWDGGHCCGAATFDLFNDDEVAALRLGGTTPERLVPPPPGDHAGCAFRGPAGCSLQPVDRPTICVRYLCPDLEQELARRGDLEAIEALAARMEGAYLRFVTLRQDRIEQETVGLP